MNNDVRVTRGIYSVLTMLILLITFGFNSVIANAEDASTLEDPYKMHYIAEDVKNEKVETSGEKITFKPYDEDSVIKGILVTGKRKTFNNATIIYKDKYDFGAGEANKIRVDGLANVGSKIFIDFYMDGETEPFKSVRLPNQSEENDWDKTSPVFTDIAEGVAIGMHNIKIKFRVEYAANSDICTLIRSVKFYKEAVPTVYVNIDEELGTIEAMNNSDDHSVNCYGKITIKTPAGFKSDYQDEEAQTTSSETYPLEYIRGRGNSTWGTTKKPYKIKLQDKADLFGMGANKHWALVANYYDLTLLRNRMTYFMGAALGMEFTPKLIPVDVIMNGNYLGSYYLSEVVRLDTNRVDIDDLEEGDSDNITGGYLLGMTPYGKEDGYKFKTKNGLGFVVESPVEVDGDTDQSKINAMNSYIEDYIQKTENAIFGEDFKDAEGKSYTEYMDLNAAVQYSLAQAVSRNGDAYVTPSTKLYKKRDGKLYWGPLWDFDYVAWEYQNYDSEDGADGLYIGLSWFNKLLGDPTYYDALKKAWYGENETDVNGMRYQLLNIAKNGGVLDQYKMQLLDSAESNYDLDGISEEKLGVKASVNPEQYWDEEPVEESYIEEIVKYNNAADYLEEVEHLKIWLQKRIKYIDENIDKMQPSDGSGFIKVHFYDGDKLIYDAEVNDDQILTDFPENPTKKGYCFAGWYGDVNEYDYESDTNILTNKRFVYGMNVWEEVNVQAKWIPEKEMIHAEKIVMLQDEAYMGLDCGITAVCTVLPENATDKVVEYRSSDPSICMAYDGGLICSGYKTGDCEITAFTVDGVSATFVVHVVDYEIPSPRSVKISESKIELEEGETTTVNYEFNPSPCVYPHINVISSDEEVATMYPTGVIVAHKAGKTKMLVFVEDSSKYEEVTVIVKPVADDSDKKEDKKEDKSGNKTDDDSVLKVKQIAKDTIFTVGKLRYQVIRPCKMSGNKITTGIVRVVGIRKGKENVYTQLTVPDTVIAKNNLFKVISIKAGAFKGSKKLKKVVIGKNVTAVGQKAFYGCKKLKTVTFKGKKCTFGKKSFAKISKKAKFYAPKKRLKVYKKALKKVGIKKVYITK